MAVSAPRLERKGEILPPETPQTHPRRRAPARLFSLVSITPVASMYQNACKLTLMAVAALLMLCSCSSATWCYNSKDFTIVSSDGVFLGNCSLNEFESDSIFNEYGTYGNSYNSKSIWNEYGNYGNPYSGTSAFNDCALNPPYILYKNGIFGRLTTNECIQNAINPYVFIAWLRKNTI